MERPIFLVGTMRSGTTLLRLILDSHERLAIADESGFLRAVAATKAIPDQVGGDGWYRRYGVSDAEMNARLRAFYDDVFSGYARSRGKQRWGDKTPFHINRIPLIAEVFPDAVVVGIVRHPGAVVASQVRRGIDATTAVQSWRNQNHRLLRAAGSSELAGRLAVLRYEDLVAEPEVILRQLVAFLGEEWSAALLRHHEAQRELGAPRVAEGGTRSRDPIDPGRAARWLRELDGAQRRTVAAATVGLREVFGYDETAAAPGGRPRVLSAGELLTRQRAVGPAALARSDPLRPGATARAAAATGWRGAARGLARFARILRSDPVYAAHRLPLVVRTRLPPDD